MAKVVGRMVKYTYRHDVQPVADAPAGTIALTDSGMLTHRYASNGHTACGRVAVRVYPRLNVETVTCQQCSGGDWTATYTTH